jgi:hypothetical protein
MKPVITVLLLLFSVTITIAQTGTYRFKDKSGATCTIAIKQHNAQLSGDVFAWWNTPSGKNGNFSGKGTIRNNACILKSVDDPDCRINLSFGPGSLTAQFNDCMQNNLPEDFSGTYKKLTDHIPGEYQVATKTYFYKTAGSNLPLKAYLIPGNKVHADLENITGNGWVYINYKNAAGKVTSGYLPWSVLKP